MSNLSVLAILSLLGLGLAGLAHADNEEFSIPIILGYDDGANQGREYLAVKKRGNDTTFFKDSATGEPIYGVSTVQQLQQYIYSHIYMPKPKPMKCPAYTDSHPKTIKTVQCGRENLLVTQWGEWEHCGYSSEQDRNIRRRAAEVITREECHGQEKDFVYEWSPVKMEEAAEGSMHCMSGNKFDIMKIPLRNLTLHGADWKHHCPEHFQFTVHESEFSRCSERGTRWKSHVVVQETECRSEHTPQCPKGCPTELSYCNPAICDRPPTYCLTPYENPCPFNEQLGEQKELYCSVHEPYVWRCQNPTSPPFMYRRINKYQSAEDNFYNDFIYESAAWA